MTYRNEPKLQLIISGIGGQGVLFITRLLAEAALNSGHAVIASETHGMAQRGGTVISHLKIGPFASPMVRSRQADGLIILHAENLPFHSGFLAPGGWVVVNGAVPPPETPDCRIFHLDATAIAQRLGHARSANLVTLGFALGHIHNMYRLYSPADVQSVLRGMGTDALRREAGYLALQTGYDAYRETLP